MNHEPRASKPRLGVILSMTACVAAVVIPTCAHAEAINSQHFLPVPVGQENSTDFMHARYYSPNLGRFVSVDPIGGDIGSSQSWNRYSYVLNNPIRMVDPFGEDEEEIPEEEIQEDGRSWGARLIDRLFGAKNKKRDANDDMERQAYEELTGSDQSRAARLEEMGEEVREFEGKLVEEAVTAAAFGAAGKGVKVLQSGGRTIKKETAEAFGVHKRELGRALEKLKRFNGVRNDSHMKIMTNGNYVDSRTGNVVDNILDYLD